ncbi:MAG: hypothetical protein IJ089_07590 [Clostridia bacterium]|nr:hypothetical protein [Clostridia bacterium]MBQ8963645.1 hypothetical protein [Clostridia bacterium]
MRHKYSDKPVQFFYIQRNADNHLLHGITVSDSKFLTSFPVWKPSRSFDWARRFSSVENAIKCATDNHITGVSVIDRAGRVLCVISVNGEVRKGA